MGYNMTQKILMKKTGREVRTGEICLITPDVVLMHETGTAGTTAALKDFPFEKPHEDLKEIVMMSDHFIPAHILGHAENQKKTREYAAQWEVKNYYEIGRAGICHQVMPEKGHVRPGEVIVVTDAHATTYGGLGCLGLGVGVTDMAMLVASGKIWLKIPKVLGIRLSGKFMDGVSAKDLAIKLLHDIDFDYLNYGVVEFFGPGVKSLSIDSRLSLCNMMSEGGIKSCLVECDQKSDEYLKGRTDKAYEPITSDSDAAYEYFLELDLGKVERMVALPHLPTNGAAVSETKGVKINQAFIGSCTNGRIEDLRAAAELLKGKKIHPSVRLIITPATHEIWKQAMQEGLLEIFADCDAVITNPTCGTCIGAHGLLAKGEVCIASSNRNFPGRMGSVESEIYLASPATVAASALAGEIV
ncbi:MAG TPA: aconitase/3-isopropylmalate dehydratase large subunit family protein [Anaerovoracaceae bacterium]|nr:aconitase/3-isopropylmalate dehydratase large subunit family protein [Anaerovoracaceae bacterium]